MKKPVFFSFHYEKDVFRLHQIRNIGAIEGQKILSSNEFEQVRNKGEVAIKNWIDDHMKYKQCVIVLIGSETYSRPWVKYEILKSWKEKKAMFGIYIHNLKCPKTGYSKKGKNPFEVLEESSRFIECHDPSINSFENLERCQVVCRCIENKIEDWIQEAINSKNLRDMFL